MAKAKNKPEKTLKAGAVSVSIFRNTSQYGVYRTCTLSIRFKSGDDWKYGNSMKTGDAIIACQLLEDARKWMMERDDNENARGAHYNDHETSKTPDSEPAASADGSDAPEDDVPF